MSKDYSYREISQAEIRSSTLTLSFGGGWKWSDAQRLHGRTVEQQFNWLKHILKDIASKELK